LTDASREADFQREEDASERVEQEVSTTVGNDLHRAFIRHIVLRSFAVGLHRQVTPSDVDWRAFSAPSVGPRDERSLGQAAVRAFQAASGAVALPVRRRTAITIFTWMQNIGVIVLLFVGWQLWGTAVAQHHAQNQLRTQFQATLRVHDARQSSAPVSLIPASTAMLQPSEGSGIARLQIPLLGVDQIVVAGTSTGDLSKGPGHYTGTATPGQEGNVAIAGHRTTDGAPFNQLGRLKTGDRIILTTSSDETLTYRVSAAPIAVAPSDVAVLNNFGDNRITLTTCTPEFSAQQRLIVVGQFQRGDIGVPQPAAKTRQTTYHVVDSATASWDFNFVPIVLVELAVLVALGLSSRRIRFRLGRLGLWLVTTPLWLLGLYFLFQSLTSFLPASV
jgi:sortase A